MSLEGFSKVEIKNDLVTSYSEVEEVLSSLREFTDEEIINNVECLKLRLGNALSFLSKYVSDEDIIEDL